MKNTKIAALCLFGAVSSASASSSVSGTALYQGGVFGDWTIGFTSSDPGFKLNSVNINLAPAGLFLDTTLAPPGATLPAPFVPTSGVVSTGFTSITPGTAAAQNGATAYTLNFSSFDSGDSFGYSVDVDQCSGVLNVPCSIVTGAEFAGATITFNFGTASDSYSQTVAFANLLSTGNDFDAAASFRSEVPEPATWAMLGTALTAIGLLRRKRQA